MRKMFCLSYMIAKSIELNLKPLISDTSYFLNKKSDNWLYTLRGYWGWAEISKAVTFVEGNCSTLETMKLKISKPVVKRTAQWQSSLISASSKEPDSSIQHSIPVNASSNITIYRSQAQCNFAMNLNNLKIFSALTQRASQTGVQVRYHVLWCQVWAMKLNKSRSVWDTQFSQ